MLHRPREPVDSFGTEPAAMVEDMFAGMRVVDALLQDATVTGEARVNGAAEPFVPASRRHDD